LKTASLALEHKKAVERLRASHQDYLEAEIRLAEAASDVEALNLRNRGISQQLEEEKRLETQAKTDAEQAKESASKYLKVCQTILAEDDGNNEYYRSISDTPMTMEELEHDIDAEKAKLDFIHGGNTGALKEFENRQVSIEKIEEKIAETSKKLERLALKIAEFRDKWEPELDKLVQEISDAFAYNFEQIGCAGEVGVHKDEDFDQWAIEIKVKFRFGTPIPRFAFKKISLTLCQRERDTPNP
jgi:chromosome segregation ATPase